MDEITTAFPENLPSTELLDFSNYLNTVSTKIPELNLSVLPSAIADFANIIMAFRQQKIDKDQFNKKCKIINDCFQMQSDNKKLELKANYSKEMKKLEVYKTTKLAELNIQKETALSKIEEYKNIRYKEIESEERKKIIELKTNFELKRQAQENDLKKFQENLKEESLKFNAVYGQIQEKNKNKELLLKDIQILCSCISNKYKKEKATEEDMKYYINLIKFQIDFFKEESDFIHSICKVFFGGNDN